MSRPGRDAALKGLPEERLSDADGLERFHREARVVASLNHPNIVTIFGVEELGAALCLAMELVDGRPLSDVVPIGGLPLARLRSFSIQLADAVSAAHIRGIIHRDLKPANVMVTGNGRVKVLDFGLARLKEPAGSGATTMPAPPATAEGRILGTAAYISPEQAEGRPVDHRSDIFSLGIVLFEMATGQRPFQEPLKPKGWCWCCPADARHDSETCNRARLLSATSGRSTRTADRAGGKVHSDQASHGATG